MNIIHEPGKFEGEPECIRYFYDLLMDGGSDETAYDGDDPVDAFFVAEEDKDKFPELSDVEVVAYYEDTSGFGYLEYMTRAEWDAFVERCESCTTEE